MGVDIQGPDDDAFGRFCDRARCRVVHNELEHHPCLLALVSSLISDMFEVNVKYRLPSPLDYAGATPRILGIDLEGGDDGSITEVDSGG